MAALWLGISSCEYTLSEPANFVRMKMPVDNPLTSAGVELGRHLFYDPILSRDSTISCSSCHQMQFGFADNRAFSRGAAGLATPRSAPSLANIGYHYRGIFWDGRAGSLEEQILLSVVEPTELATEWPTVLRRLSKHPSYPRKFNQAFGNGQKIDIDSLMVANAIAQFERTLISSESKYDRYLRGEIALNELEERGRLIFFDEVEDLPDAECGHCHTDPLFTSLQYFNNGIEQTDSLELFKDKGLGGSTGKYYDIGKFKTPTLRNVALNPPYMHDGRFESLAEVIEHYNRGGHYTENASPNVRPLHLTDLDKAGLLAFLHCLTDSTFLTNRELADPHLNQLQ